MTNSNKGLKQELEKLIKENFYDDHENCDDSCGKKADYTELITSIINLVDEEVRLAYDRGYADKAIKADKDLVERVMQARKEEWAKIHTKYQKGAVKGRYIILEAVRRVGKNTKFRVECQDCHGVMFRYANKFNLPHKNCVNIDMRAKLKGVSNG